MSESDNLIITPQTGKGDGQILDEHGNFAGTPEQLTTPRLVDQHGERLKASRFNHADTDLLKGFVAGMVGGLVGTAVKSLAEQVFPPRPPEADSPPVTMAERALGHELDETGKQVAEQSIHWTFGAVTGGTYGALVEAVPKAGAGYGVPFSAVLFAGAHEVALPALGLEEGITEQPVREQVNEFITHVAFGVTTDLVRRYVRKLL